jgi:enoyl-[acyl-carrier protein] reductase II
VLRTRFCELLDIEAPVLQAAIWPATSPELVAAVSEAGALGTVAAIFSTGERLREQINRVRSLTERPFVVNHVVPNLDEGAFQATLDARPAGVSFALGHPGRLVERAHAAGVKVIHQVHTVEQAREAAELGVDVVIAQGSEAGGQGIAAGAGTLALVPQVADAVAPIPVLAAGGVADGRGLAAALALGAAGVNVGTRFLASEEASTDDGWKQGIVEAESEETVRFDTWSAIMPPRAPGAYEVVPRVMRTDFVREWESRGDEAASEAERLRDEIMRAVREGRTHELVPFTGQSAGLVRDIEPAAAIVRDLVAGAERALDGIRREDAA